MKRQERGLEAMAEKTSPPAYHAVMFWKTRCENLMLWIDLALEGSEM